MSYFYKKDFKFTKNKQIKYSHILEKYENDGFFPLVGSRRIELNSIDEYIKIIKDENASNIVLYKLNDKEVEYILSSLNDLVECLEVLYFENNKEGKYNLQSLSYCKNLHSVTFNITDKKITLWELNKTPKLKRLEILGIKKIINQEALIGSNVETLIIRRYSHGAPDAKQLTINDFSIFKTMPNLQYLDLFIAKKKKKEKDLIELSKLENIKEIHLPKNYFYFNQYAWLSSKLNNVKGIGCINKIEYDHANEMDSYIINGSRKPWRILEIQQQKLDKYQKEFNKLIEYYKGINEPPLK